MGGITLIGLFILNTNRKIEAARKKAEAEKKKQ